MTDLKKVDQFTNEFTVNRVYFIENNDTKLPNVTDLKKIVQTLNEFINKKDDLTNLPTKFTENIVTNLPNVTDLKKVDQPTN